MESIEIWNRYTNTIEKEKVYGSKAIDFLYCHPFGKKLVPFFVSHALSKAYGHIQDWPLSSKKVKNFVKNFNIPVEDYENGQRGADELFEDSFASFNDFFIRKFKPGKREFISNTNELAALAEGRYSGVASVDEKTEFPVKGEFLNPLNLIFRSKYQDYFQEGPLLVARLCPVDYHRYHYPDDGKTLESYTVPGSLYSVNPKALQFDEEIFIKNERRVSILETKNFGKLAYIEVGATMVGKIIQSFNERNPFLRGDEKGYFLFGGSTVILIGEKGRWKPSDDILDYSSKSKEVYIHLGDSIGVKL